MNKRKVKSAGQCSFKLSGFYLFSIGSLTKARKLIPGFLFLLNGNLYKNSRRCYMIIVNSAKFHVQNDGESFYYFQWKGKVHG